MAKLTYDVINSKQFVNLERQIIDDYFLKYKIYVDKFEKYGLKLLITPCYYYRGQYKTKKNSHCFLAFRIQLFPCEYSYSQATRKFLSKKFFSKKIAKFDKTSTGWLVNIKTNNDIALHIFLRKYLKKAEFYYVNSLDTKRAVKETFVDNIRSIIYAYRYRNEIKCSYYGRNIEWFYIVIVLLIICISVYYHLKRISSIW